MSLRKILQLYKRNKKKCNMHIIIIIYQLVYYSNTKLYGEKLQIISFATLQGPPFILQKYEMSKLPLTHK